VQHQDPRSDLFGEPSLAHLAKHAKLVSLPSAVEGVAGVFRWLSEFSLSIADLFYTGRDYQYVDGSTMQFQYEAAIRGTFFSSPERSAINPRIDELAPLIARHRLPFLIVNATVGHGEAPAGTFSKRIFEYTPVLVGADSVGRYPPSLPEHMYPTPKERASALREFQLSRVVRISGAALDAVNTQNVLGQSVVRLVQVDLGAKVQLVDAFGARRAFLYLADGGFADNLGAYSLIRRLCEEVIISDAEFDPSYQFGAYRKLKDALAKEMHVALSVEGIDKAIGDDERGLTSSPHGSADYLAPQRACPPVGSFDGTQPVMRGIVRSFPVLESTGIVDRAIDMVYLKLSLDRREFDDALVAGTADLSALQAKYSPDVVNWYEARRKVEQGCPDFPQLSTVHQNFTPTQFRAYVDLGYKMVLNNWTVFDPSRRLSRKPH
jgi:hypothetical protein